MQVLVVLLLLTFSTPALSCKLEGQWKSHKTKTLAELYGTPNSNSEKLKLARIYGKAIVQYSNCNKATVNIDRYIEEYSFEIIEEKASFVTIKYLPSGDMAILIFDGNCFKSPVKGMAFYEHFCKL